MILDGKVAVITGTSRGLGKTIAELFKQEGATVIEASREMGYELSDPLFIHNVQGRYIFNGNILVNCAAIQGPVGAFGEVDLATWNEAMQVNFLAPVALCQWAIRCGVRKIINISGGGAAKFRPCYSAYASAKTALVRFSEILAHEYPDVDINCVAPGDLGPMGSDHEGHNYDLINAAQLCLYLASSESDGLTGRFVSAVWDGWRTFPERKEKIMADPDIYTLRREITYRNF